MPTREPSVESWLGEEKDFYIISELGKKGIEEAKKLVAGLVSDQYSQDVAHILKWPEILTFRSRVLSSIKYIFDDQVLEITPVYIWLQLLGQRDPTVIADLFHPDTIIAFKGLLDEHQKEKEGKTAK